MEKKNRCSIRCLRKLRGSLFAKDKKINGAGDLFVSGLEISRFSLTYNIRKLNETDIPIIYDLCSHNPQYYEYCQKNPEETELKKVIREDLTALPPGKTSADKYYVGFFDKEELIAVMDVIDGYHEKNMAFIGFFMMNAAYAARGIGTEIITELSGYFKGEGIRAIRLGIDKGNPQSTHFWAKNGFAVIREVPREEGTILLAEKRLESRADERD